ncbi:MAG: TIGR03790 family protein [Desulfobaccales bacterium]
MKTQVLRLFAKPRCLAFLMLLAWSLIPSVSLALSARDLVIVFNRNLPESQAVASYYADKRKVPPENLVGVDVSSSEDMTRNDYDRKLVPPVKAIVDRLKAKGNTPAILLIYGIPLRVGAAPLTEPEMELKTMANAKVEEYQVQALDLINKLDRLTGGMTPVPPLTATTPEILKKSQETLIRTQEFLRKLPATPEAEKIRSETTTLLIKLVGSSPEARALMARMARHQSPRQRELLGMHPVTLEQIEQRMFRGILPSTAKETAADIRSANGLLAELKFWYEAKQIFDRPQTVAAVDSELTLIIAGPYQKIGWLPNPFNIGFDRISFINDVRNKTLMVGRLDGPTPAIARRLVDDALEVEQKGLTGVIYLDARGLTGKEEPGNYVWFDHHLIHLYDLIKQYSDMQVVLDKKPEVFPPGSCPDAALYCGWYSLRNYVPAFTWNKGSVGYHVASAEATTLKKPGSNVWCKRMLEEGVAATLGPVAEPYLQSFPLPDQFFPLLMTGKLSLLEVYFHTVPYLSWMQILIGDPLYRPFKNHPAIHPPKNQLGPGQPAMGGTVG